MPSFKHLGFLIRRNSEDTPDYIIMAFIGVILELFEHSLETPIFVLHYLHVVCFSVKSSRFSLQHSKVHFHQIRLFDCWSKVDYTLKKTIPKFPPQESSCAQVHDAIALKG